MQTIQWLRDYGSPAYVYDLGKVRAAHAALRAALPDSSRLYYSLKANPHPALVRALGQLGCWAEVSSAGELETALGSGLPPQHLLFTGPGKSPRDIEAALRSGVTTFSADSPNEIDKVACLAERHRIRADLLLRVNPDTGVPGHGLAMTGIPSQFGADASWIRQEPGAFANRDWAHIIGFHIYMGSNLTSPDTLTETFRLALKLSVELAGLLGIEPQVLDLGGGFGHPYATPGELPDFSAIKQPLEETLDLLLPAWRRGSPAIAFEAGRYLVAGAGMLHCAVQDVKVSKGRTYLILDSGINHLGGMSGLRRVPRAAIGLAAVGEAREHAMQEVEVVGPLCTPLDHLTRCAELPELRPGETVCVPNVGAYGLTASLLAFLSHTPPAEIVVDGDKVIDASRLMLHRTSLMKGV